MTTSSFAPVNGGQLYYESKGNGHPLLLLHAGIADSRMWDAQFDTFAEHFHTIRFDLRGFGQTKLSAGHFAYHEDVIALLDHLGIAQAHLVGISFGGLIALDTALAYPDRVTRLVLGAPSVSGSPPSERVRTFWTEEDEMLEKGDIDGATELNIRLWVDGPHRTPDQVPHHVREQIRIMQRDAFLISEPDDLTQEGLEPPALDRLAEVNVPTLVIIGTLDLEEKLVLTDRLVAELADAQKVVIPDVAHMMSMETPEVFNAAVLGFLGK